MTSSRRSADPIATSPKPRRKLLRSLLKWPRNLRRFSPRISYDEAAANLPDAREAEHWGQVILLSDALLVLHRDGTASRLFHLISQLHGDQDLAEWDDVRRDFDPRNTRETIRKAELHLPDGTTRKATKTTTRLDSQSQSIQLTFAPLRPGAVLELESQIDRFIPFDVGPGIWSQMFLQGSAPRRRVRLVVAVAQPFEARFKLHHCDWQPTESDEFGYRVYRWDLNDMPGVEIDQWTPPVRDFLPWVNLTTLHSWEPVAKHYTHELEPPAKTAAPVKKLVTELTNDAQSDREKVLAVYQYNSRDVRYGRHPKEVDLEAPRDAETMIEDLRGDCKDKSALMVSMLRELGFPAKIALVQTRMNGETPSLPAPWFDHALVRTVVDDKELWLDAAGGPCTFGELPYNDQGVEALLLDHHQLELCMVPMGTADQHRIERTCRGTLEENGTYQFEALVCAGGEDAVALRSQYLERDDDHRRRLLEQTVAVALTGAKVTEAEFVELADLTSDVSYRYKMRLLQWARLIEQILLFRVPWAEPALTTEPVSAASRVQTMAAPGVLGLSERHEIELPDRFAGYGLPYAVREECQWGSYRCDVQVENAQLVCERRVEYRGGVVPPERFSEFKQFWETCARSDAADIVLMKSVS